MNNGFEKVSMHQFLREQQALHPEATGALTDIMADTATVAKEISYIVNTAGLDHEILAATNSTNVQGEIVQVLDELSNEKFKTRFSQNPNVAGFASEEDDTFTQFSSGPRRRYCLWFDPLDGSKNFAKNVSIGSIFGIYPRVSDHSGPVTEADFLQPGRNLVASGYFLYGPSTKLVYTAGDGVHVFTLDPRIGEFVLPRNFARVVTPNEGTIYSINEGHRPLWTPETTTFVNQLQNEGYDQRYIGSMVADIHRNLDGGVFAYPSNKKSPNGKLRLTCELNPLAFLIEQAGGMATDGINRILDIQPREMHQRVPFVAGSRREVELYRSIASQLAQGK